MSNSELEPWEKFIRDTTPPEDNFDRRRGYYSYVDPDSQEILDGRRLMRLKDEESMKVGAERMRNVVVRILQDPDSVSITARHHALYYLPNVHIMFMEDEEVQRLTEKYKDGFPPKEK
jgi:hypothetical protein